MLPAQCAVSSGGQRTGGQRRKDANRLPRPLWIVDKSSSHIIGVAIVVDAVTDARQEKYAVHVSMVCAFLVPVPYISSMARYTSDVFEWTTAVEASLRMQEVEAGGIVNDHFDRWSESKWKVMSWSAHDLAPLRQGIADPSSTTRLRSSKSVIARFGCSITVIPEEVTIGHSSNDDLPDDAEVQCARQARADEPPRSLTLTVGSIALARSGGAVEYMYKPEAILGCLKLARSLKPGAKLTSVLGNAAVVLFGRDAIPVANDLKAGEYAVPNLTLIRQSRVRLDVCRILFEQKRFLRGDYCHYCMLDSSPQLGYNVLAVIYDTFFIPSPHTLTIHTYLMLNSPNYYFEHLCPTSSIGLGKAGLLMKSRKTANLTLMTSRDVGHVEVRRKGHRGTVSDEGTEHGFGDIDLSVLPQGFQDISADGNDSFLYPFSLTFSDMLHLLFNGLQQAVEESADYDGFLDVLRVTAAFSNNKGVRNRFVELCFEVGVFESNLFKKGAKCHIDWKWNFLAESIDLLLPRFRVLQTKLDAKKMLAGDSGKLDNQTITNMDSYKDDEMFEGLALGYVMHGKIVEEFAADLEKCDCHQYLWTSATSRKRRLKQIEDDIGQPHCVFQGRRLAWFIAVGYDLLIERIKHSTTPEYDECLAKLDPPKRTRLVVATTGVRTRILDYYTDKLSWVDHCPYTAIGAFYSNIDGNIKRGQALLRKSVEEFDAAVAAGRGNKLHRVAHRLFAKGSAVRAEADAWLASPDDTPMITFPVLYKMLLEYALIMIVTRRIEAVHGAIKRVGAAFPGGASLAHICASLREPQNVNLLETDQEFEAFCLEQWRRRSLFDDVLRLRFSKDTLIRMSQRDKLLAIYQTGLAEEFVDMAAEAATRKQWLVATAINRTRPEKVSEVASNFASLFKALFEVGCIFLMPTRLFNLCTDTDQQPANVSDEALDLVLRSSNAPAELPAFSSETMTMFEVTANQPEKRVHVQMHHLDQHTDRVHVKVCKVFEETSNRVAVLNNSADTHVEFSVLRLLRDGNDGDLESILRWDVHKTVTQPAMKPPTEQMLSQCGKKAFHLPALADESSNAVIACQEDPWQHFSNADEMRTVVSTLAKRDAYHSSCNSLSFLDDFGDISSDSVLDLVSMGVVSTVETDFGELRLSLCPRAVEWQTFVGVNNARRWLTLSTTDVPSKMLKAELLIRLHRLGFSPGHGLRALVAGSDLVYVRSIHKQKSYFAALAMLDVLFEKGVPAVEHNQPDSYYRCLIALDGAKLQSFLAGYSAASSVQSFGLLALADANGPDQELEVEDVAMVADEPCAAAALPALAELPEGWSRCIAHLGGDSLRLKVYFDNSSGGSVQQRGLVECTHSCRCRKHVNTFGTKLEFCAYYYQWNCDGDRDDITSRAEHLNHVPHAWEVIATMSSLSLDAF